MKTRSAQKGAADWTDADYLDYWKSKCIVSEQGCWLWQGWVHPRSGYADGCYRGKKGRLHRLVYQAKHGYTLLPGWDVCHTCDIRNCINPLHLFAGHRMLNMQDMKAKGRCSKQKITHCPRGHELAGENLIVDNRGWRFCRICERERQRRAYHNALYRKKHGLSKDPPQLQLGSQEQRSGD